MFRSLCCLVCLAGTVSSLFAADEYLGTIKPLLARKCVACHGPLKQEGGLRLDTAAAMTTGDADARVIQPRFPETSRLLARVSATDPAERMPPEGEGEPLTAAQIDVLRQWIAEGAPAPENETALSSPKDHWAYRPPVQPTLPNDAPPEWSATSIDRLLSQHHRELGLQAVAAADRTTLLRRITLDLTGLPPTPNEIDAFLADDSATAWETVVDRLLASPAYGERWGRHWMDVWRYSDWDGYRDELRSSSRHIWHWRDWIIESLNADKPYDQMLREMLAGDELAPDDPATLRATGFLARNYFKFNRNTWLDTTIDHTAKAFLGITMECAKCHDHKYDPITHDDYYQLRAIFEPHEVRTDRLASQPNLDLDGLPRAFDGQPETQTFKFLRGNEKSPDKDHPLSPQIPAIFEQSLVVTPQPLPVLAYYPALQAQDIAALEAQVQTALAKAETAHTEAQQRVTQAEQQLAGLQAAAENPPTASPMLWEDRFTQLDESRWATAGGMWTFDETGAHQAQIIAERSSLISKKAVPRDVVLTTKFRLIGGQQWHSIGISFDDESPQRNDAIYISAHPPTPKIQFVAQRQTPEYSAKGQRKLDIQRDREYTVELRLQDRWLNAYVNGEPALAFEIPHERVPGKIGLWTFDCTADFQSFSVSPLDATAPVHHTLEAMTARPTIETATAQLQQSKDAVAVTAAKLKVAQLTVQATAARIAADRAKYLTPEAMNIAELKATATQAERDQNLAEAEVVVLEATQKHQAVLPQGAESDAVKKAAEAVTAAEKKRDTAAAELTKSDGTYTPVGKEYPRESTGRRLAFAQWITDRSNPLTARVAVNHVWQRMFGEPLVANMFDFGLRSPRPPLADLLDSLAVDFMDQGWNLKQLHKSIAMSRTYQLSSTASPELTEANSQLDRDNHYLWKAAVRRLEAEAVRDSVLAVCGQLDRTTGGPDLDFAEGEKILRRSVYFRHAYEKQMTFLLTFDAASPNECYRRSHSVIPQQALAMVNSPLVAAAAQHLAREMESQQLPDAAFIQAAFRQILTRSPTTAEATLCTEYLQSRSPEARQILLQTLINHHDFLTVR
ncbi:DUF1549 domain-containing protein [bacterium]|nr:DUF1549 domain-containing protein [bacterium]